MEDIALAIMLVISPNQFQSMLETLTGVILGDIAEMNLN